MTTTTIIIICITILVLTNFISDERVKKMNPFESSIYVISIISSWIFLICGILDLLNYFK